MVAFRIQRLNSSQEQSQGLRIEIFPEPEWRWSFPWRATRRRAARMQFGVVNEAYGSESWTAKRRVLASVRSCFAELRDLRVQASW